MDDEPGNDVLKGVSRSFYLSLRLLPGPMRGPASLAYLLARTSDTLADSTAVPADRRLECLDSFGAMVLHDGRLDRWSVQVTDATPDPRERSLLEMTPKLVEWLRRIPDDEAELIREVLGIIISGQSFDLSHFASATVRSPVALPDDAALDDYTWRVAGCVGAFWTKLGFLTLGDQFSVAPKRQLLEWGVAYGKGLQLVNVLRDLPIDLSMGRCYLPVEDPADLSLLMDCHARWLERAYEWVGEGESYAKSLRSRRLRAASVLPAWIAQRTLESLRGVDWERLEGRIKVPRRDVYRLMFQAFFQFSGPGTK